MFGNGSEKGGGGGLDYEREEGSEGITMRSGEGSTRNATTLTLSCMVLESIL